MPKSKLQKIKQKKPLVFKLRGLAVALLLVYAIIVLVSQQVTIAEKKKENIKNHQMLVIAQQNNEELNRLVSMTDEKQFMERYAIERLGYAYPDEIRVFDVSKN